MTMAPSTLYTTSRRSPTTKLSCPVAGALACSSALSASLSTTSLSKTYSTRRPTPHSQQVMVRSSPSRRRPTVSTSARSPSLSRSLGSAASDPTLSPSPLSTLHRRASAPATTTISITATPAATPAPSEPSPARAVFSSTARSPASQSASARGSRGQTTGSLYMSISPTSTTASAIGSTSSCKMVRATTSPSE